MKYALISEDQIAEIEHYILSSYDPSVQKHCADALMTIQSLDMKEHPFTEVLDSLDAITQSDWRTWQELASEAEFERWVKSRTNHAATTIRATLAQPVQPSVENNYHDAYRGARDDLLKWKKRAFKAEENAKSKKVGGHQ